MENTCFPRSHAAFYKSSKKSYCNGTISLGKRHAFLYYKRMENNKQNDKPKFMFTVSVYDESKKWWRDRYIVLDVKATDIDNAKEIAKRMTGSDNIPCICQATHYPC